MYLKEPKQSYVIIYGICLAYMVMYTSASFESCKSNVQCKKGYCCAGHMKSYGGYCMRNQQLGELCSNTYVKGTTFTCGCTEGLTCAIIHRDKLSGSIKHRCVEIPPEAKEFQDKNNSSITITKYLTSFELKRLLKIIKEKPKL